MWRPLSRRGTQDAGEFETPKESVPAYLMLPLQRLAARAFTVETYGGQRVPNVSEIERFQLAQQLDPPLTATSPKVFAASLMRRMEADPELALDVVDYIVAHPDRLKDEFEQPHDIVQAAIDVLQTGNSVWEVTRRPGGWYQLTRRDVAPIADVLQGVSASERARHHLHLAWSNLAGRNPNPSTAYREALRAVEVAAKPVVSPTDQQATLGKMRNAMRDAPAKWAYVLGDLDVVIKMCDSIWTGQLDRHGTDDAAVPLSVSHEQADAAFHVALALVRLFSAGLVRRVDP